MYPPTRRKFTASLGVLLAIFLTAAATPRIRSQTVTPVPALDKKSLTGTWYEIARLPNKREKHCAADAVELVALGDKSTHLQLVDACTDVKGYKDSWNFTAITKNGSGALKVRTIFPFSRKYWLLAIDTSTTQPAWTLIGSPNHKALWIYARTKNLSGDDMERIKDVALAQGFDPSKLFVTPTSQ